MLNWNTLDPDEQRVMDAGIDGEALVFAYVGWIPDPDVYYPNRAHKYVPPLMEAAQRLVRRGLLGIVPAQEAGPPRELPLSEALEVVGDINNWWRYHPDLAGDDPEDNFVGSVPFGIALEHMGDGELIKPGEIVDSGDPFEHGMPPFEERGGI